MSLALFLPLNGDFINKGLSKNTFSSMGSASFSTTDGLVSPFSLSLDKSKRQFIQSDDKGFMDKYINNHSFTISAWIKTSDPEANIVSLSYGVRLKLNGGDLILSMFDNKAFSQGARSNVKANNGNWCHVCGTYDVQYSRLEVYINGELVGYDQGPYVNIGYESQWTNGLFVGRDPNNSSDTDYASALIQDVRVYDEYLSQKEIRNLASGHIISYGFANLNPYLEETVNLGGTSIAYENMDYDSPYSASGWGGDTGTITYFPNGGYNNYPYVRYFKGTTGSGGIFKKTDNDIKIVSGKTYTVSAYVKANINFDESSYSFNINRGADNYYITYPTTVHFTQNWTRLSFTFTATAETAGMYGFMGIVYSDKIENLEVCYSGFQVEEKDHATPFTLNSRHLKIKNETLYSGYNLFGSNFKQVSLENSGTYYIDLKEKNQFLHSEKSGELSFIKNGAVVLWAKYAPGSTYQMCLSDEGSTSNYLGAATTGNWYNGNCGSSVEFYCDGKKENVVKRDGEWHFYVFNKVNLSAFKGKFNIATYGGSVNNSWSFHGDLLKYDIYVQPLSQSKIQELYETKCYFLNNSKIETNKIIEKNDNLILKTTYNMSNPASRFTDIMKHSTYNTFIPDNVSGLSYYAQAKNRVEITSNGVHVFSPPNIPKSEQNMYGGVAFQPLNLGKDKLQKGHTYLITWTMVGQSTRAPSLSWTNNYGWGGGGLSPDPHFVKYIAPSSNFRGAKKCYYQFTIEDDIWKVCTSSYSSFVKGETYLSYVAFTINYGYGDTGPLGTDIYVKDAQMFDITADNNFSPVFSKFSTVSMANYSEINRENYQNDLKNLLIKKEDDGSLWARIFWHNNKAGTELFKSQTEALKADSDYKYSRLCYLGNSFTKAGKYEFKLEYPADEKDKYNRWKQTSNPKEETEVTGYEPVHIDWTGQAWQGLAKNGSSAFIDGSKGGMWFYAIGAYSKYDKGIPSYAATDSVTSLWVRIDGTAFYENYQKELTISTKGAMETAEIIES